MISRNKVLVIGIEGATFNIIKPLIDEGKLPNFQSLINQGISGVVNSEIPIMSATGWTSLVTGQNSSKHNIYDFYNGYNGSYKRPIVNSGNVKAKRIWQILKDFNLKSIIMNVPVTYPPEPINGVLVSGILSPMDSKYTFPSYITKELDEQGYIVDIYKHYCDTLNSYLELAEQTMIKRQQCFRQLLQNHEWDFAMVVFTTIDRMQHQIWNRRDLLEKLYIRLDTLIGQLIEENKENTYSIIVSDHGFKSVTKKFFVNEWLWDLKLLSKKISTDKSSIPNFYDDHFSHQCPEKSKLSNVFAKTGITKDNIRSLLPDLFCELLKKISPPQVRRLFPKENLLIEWDKTKAFFPSYYSQGIRINVKGREPKGIVEPGQEYEEIRSQIINELYKLKNPYNFENVIDTVYRKEELYSGKNHKNMPDIIFIPNNYNYYLDPNKRTCKYCVGSAIDDFPVYSDHDPNGILIINGHAIKKNTVISNIDIVDVMPNILRLLDIPIPDDIDGQIKNEILEKMNITHRDEILEPYSNSINF